MNIMIMTFDFLIYARNNDKFKKELIAVVNEKRDKVIFTEIHKMTFKADREVVLIEPMSDTSPFHHKIRPVEIKYKTMLN